MPLLSGVSLSLSHTHTHTHTDTHTSNNRNTLSLVQGQNVYVIVAFHRDGRRQHSTIFVNSEECQGLKNHRS